MVEEAKDTVVLLPENEIKRYRFADLYVGMTESFNRVVTESMVRSYCGITGDVNPLHCSDEFAKEHGFPERVVYGLLTTSFLSTLAGCYMPGERSLIQEVSVKLAKPVFIGDELRITGEIAQINKSVQRIVMDVHITNQNDVEVLRGTMKVGVLND